MYFHVIYVIYLQYTEDNFLVDLEKLEKGMYDDWKQSAFK
jgi:hypothetical protein